MKKNFLMVCMLAVLSAILGMASIASAEGITGTFVGAVDGVNSFDASDGVSTFSTEAFDANHWLDRGSGTPYAAFDIASISPSGGYEGTLARHNASGIVTTLTGLTEGTSYEIRIIHGVDVIHGSYADPPLLTWNQDIAAGFTAGSLTTLSDLDSTDTGLVLGAGDPWYAFEQVIGTAVADTNGEIKVYVKLNPDLLTEVDTGRSIYNGLSYVVVPEPSTLVLLCFGWVGVMAGRCRRR